MLGEGPEPVSAVNAGAAVADETLSHILGIGVNYFVGVDFDAFKQAVDAVGGINIDVPADEIKRRLAAWKAPEPRYKTGVFAKYVALVGSASEGAMLKP